VVYGRLAVLRSHLRAAALWSAPRLAAAFGSAADSAPLHVTESGSKLTALHSAARGESRIAFGAGKPCFTGC